MKALGVLAGPRKGKATDLLIDSVLKGLKDRGAEVEKISLYDYDIKPCTGCCACHGMKACEIKDDQRMLMDKMAGADVVVFGSPVYWANVTSVAKKFFDRLGPFFKMTATGPLRTADKPSRVILIAACGAPYPFSHLMGIIPGCIRAMKATFGRMKAKVNVLYAAGMTDPTTSKPSAKLLKKAYALGKNI